MARRSRAEALWIASIMTVHSESGFKRSPSDAVTIPGHREIRVPIISLFSDEGPSLANLVVIMGKAAKVMGFDYEDPRSYEY